MKNIIINCENIIKDKFFYIPKLLPNCKVEKIEGFTVTKSPYLSSMFNISWVEDIDSLQNEESICKIISYFSPNPFALWKGGNQLSLEFDEILQKQGFLKEANEVSMVLELGKVEEKKKESELSRIIEVKNENGMSNFIDVLENYDLNVRDYYSIVSRDLGFSKDNPYRFFYLGNGDKSVCIASLFFRNGMCGIFDVLTHDDFRKQGYASLMMHYLISYAKKHGAKYMALTASSPEAVRIYKKLGFIEMGYYGCFEYKGINGSLNKQSH